MATDLLLEGRTAAGRVYRQLTVDEDAPVELGRLLYRTSAGRVFRSNVPGQAYDQDVFYDDPNVTYGG